ncbi:hypothetical protein K488DRAFT_45632 [Vararia minispora EC-137]|uniref:Uncharacterized protein n=1 Tax=Vararia minispora EC-137 TaxID=1314806 RepID=A0ACB8QRY7_9AGAM|nr:hypothetical protein K488DRAFT_45632 [Vararia minispora EC-137]
MSSARYAPLPNPRSTLDAERELNDAFDDDASDHGETTPLTVHVRPPTPPPRETPAGTYDFERDYDYPPPGSPPGPSSSALPNNFGNSNGVLPMPAVVPAFHPSRPSFFRRTINALLPSHYQRLPTQPQAPGHGSGVGNDGVFANVTAKPSRPIALQTDDGEVYVVPEDTQAEAPPPYASASADAVPAYWETTVHAPPPLILNGDMIIDEMPTGPLITFLGTTLISWFFQFPGFLLTYLLHGTHAGRFGSQAGLALTLIQFGFSATVTRGVGGDDGNGNGIIIVTPSDGDQTEPVAPTPTDPGIDAGSDDPMYTPGREWISFLLMTIGWFLLLTSIIGYVRVKRFEMSIRAAQVQNTPMSPEDARRHAAIRRAFEEVFGFTLESHEEPRPRSQPREAPAPRVTHAPRDEREAELMAQETRLEHDLREAGLL